MGRFSGSRSSWVTALPDTMNVHSERISTESLERGSTEHGDNWAKDLGKEVKVECAHKYVKAVHVAVDSNTNDLNLASGTGLVKDL